MNQNTTSSETDVEPRKVAWPLRFFSWVFRTSTKLLLIAGFIALGLFVGGFLKFSAVMVDHSPAGDTEMADGIVVLTGGTNRIGEALKLMQAKKGQRLLISGVNDSITLADLRKAHEGYDLIFDCCVDVETVALNTVGNARETAKWVENKGYSSIIVVTSGYHMPRSLLEFRRHMPQVKLIAHRVSTARLEDKSWWRDMGNLRFVMSEYLKYVGAQMRQYMPAGSVAALQRTITWV